MDLKQREQFRDVVLDAMADKAWSAAVLSKESGISATTITKVTRAQKVAPGTVGKIRKTLGITSLAGAQTMEGYSPIIEVVRDAVGMWLRDVPDEELAGKVAALFAAIANS